MDLLENLSDPPYPSWTADYIRNASAQVSIPGEQFIKPVAARPHENIYAAGGSLSLVFWNLDGLTWASVT